MTHVNTLPEYLSSLCEYIKNLFPNKYCSISDTNKVHHKRKYELVDILVDILFVTENGIAWRKLKDRTTKGISWNTLYNHFKFLSKNNVFQKYYEEQTTNYYK